ncbi:mitochondrial import receptor subunit tom20 [Dispira parvispora]|uniref:Mitochondrial import receptor subunit tom20 n=1 Tax=Dispira parvispora TaxID=1520584 RepID=A0A9W8E8G5_9FUNG|nr:mitochondrial import receptor subunit tom20 [Dispira parvispora]
MKNSTAITLAALGTLGVAGLGYALYFDYKRRNDPTFRKKLHREKKKAMKQQEEKEKLVQSQLVVSVERALDKALVEPFPTSREDKERMFMEHVAQGEAAVAGGEAHYEDAAVAFYRALKIYPDPLELIMIYQKTVPKDVLNIIMGMLSQDVKRRQENYYNTFPPEDMHVKIQDLSGNVDKDQPGKRKVVVAQQDFAVGDIIYSESPEVSILMPSVKGEPYCDFCLHAIADPTTQQTCDNCDVVRYCSTDCKDKAYEENHRYLCPGNVSDPNPVAQQLYDTWADRRELAPLLIAKFFGHMIAVEKQKQLAGTEGDYTVWERLEHLEFLSVDGSSDDKGNQKAICELVGRKVSGLEDFMTEERYLSLKGKMLYNAIGVRAPTNDDAAPSMGASPASEYVRAAGTSDLVGAGIYLVSSYIKHSCEPNVVPTFPEGTNRLSIKVTHPIKKGEEITMAYVNVGDRPTEARQQELYQKYRFTCTCPRCTEALMGQD